MSVDVTFAAGNLVAKGSFNVTAPVVAPTTNPTMPADSVVSNGRTWNVVNSCDFTTDMAKGTAIDKQYASAIGFYTDPTGAGGKYSWGKTVTVSNSNLDIYMHNENGQGYGAGLAVTSKTGEWKWLGGRFSVRFRADASAAGYGSAIMLWPASNVWGDGEIDYPEGDFGGSFNLYQHGLGANAASNYLVKSNLGKWSDWHTTTVEWVPGVSLRYYLDGNLVASVTDPANVATAAHHFIIQAAVHGSGDNPPPPLNSQGHFQIDWVHVAQ